MPQYYIDNPGMTFQFFSQQDSGSYTGDLGSSDYTLADAEDLGGGDYKFTRTFTSDVRVNVVTDPVRVGLKLHRGSLDTGGTAGADVLLRNMTIQYAP